MESVQYDVMDGLEVAFACDEEGGRGNVGMIVLCTMCITIESTATTPISSSGQRGIIEVGISVGLGVLAATTWRNKQESRDQYLRKMPIHMLNVTDECTGWTKEALPFDLLDREDSRLCLRYNSTRADIQDGRLENHRLDSRDQSSRKEKLNREGEGPRLWVSPKGSNKIIKSCILGVVRRKGFRDLRRKVRQDD